jgi:hypothetical protein
LFHRNHFRAAQNWDARHPSPMCRPLPNRSLCSAAGNRGSGLPPAEKLLIITLLEYRQGDTPTQATLADYLHVTERRVRQLIAGLVQSGVLTRHRVRREARYSVRSTHRLLCRG